VANSRTASAAPRVSFRLELDPALIRALTLRRLQEEIRKALIDGFDELMGTLGVPGEPDVEITDFASEASSADRFIRLTVNGRSLQYPDELLRAVQNSINNVSGNPKITSATLLTWLTGLTESQSEAAKITAFVLRASLEMVKRRPSVLLDQAQLGAYLSSLPTVADASESEWRDRTPWLLSVLRGALNLKMSIANTELVSGVLEQTKGKTSEDACEQLINALHSNSIEIHLSQEYLRELTTVDIEARTGLFPFLREGMFAELGMMYPTFHFVPDERLPYPQFMFKINDIEFLPVVGLEPEQCLVNDTTERLHSLLNIDAQDATNPATGQPASITALEKKETLEKNGFTTWDQMQLIVLSMAEHLRKNGACLVHIGGVQQQLAQVEVAFPALVKKIQSQWSVHRVTRILRSLASEEISIRNLRLILERLLDYELQDDAAIDHDEVVSFLRVGLMRQLSHKYARGTTTVVVYLLDQRVEELVRETISRERQKAGYTSPEEDSTGLSRLLAGLRQEMTYLPPTASLPALLTRSDMRSALREAIATEFPRVPVVSYDETLPNLNVQPIARIYLAA
jgi:hypothetical protein